MIHIYIEISQENSLHSYLYLKHAKLCIFSLFSSTKSENKRAEWVLAEAGPERWVGGVGTCGRGKVAGKGDRKMNMGQKCLHMYVNAKMRPVKTIPRIQGEVDKGERSRG
jgi:hypothetical protein